MPLTMGDSDYAAPPSSHVNKQFVQLHSGRKAIQIL